ncbi:hypothetical protein Y032_0417g1089 [Ancylostoma ceylanicum]|uniref:Thioredoxin-like fold domain-containing protein n=1 Tax=Ancylostoma ceylanicum TaxID=53326 RepID=A0A016X3B3_9BILA|nr:hypothetical protein Y032_0417g1089 [Ancylostoma ceylanicum]
MDGKNMDTAVCSIEKEVRGKKERKEDVLFYIPSLTFVRQILILPPQDANIHETAQDELQSLIHFLTVKMDEYKEFLQHNSAVVFAVNYIQNRYISAEFCAEIEKLYEVLNVKTMVEFQKALEAIQNEPQTESDVISYQSHVKEWDAFIDDIEAKLDEKIGPCSTSTKNTEEEEVPELGVESKTVSHYVKGSPFEMVLVVVVRSFNSPDTNQHILALYNKISEFHRLGCDVFLLTKGPPIGSRGGAYIKLVGVPFRKLYDEDEALTELKSHRLPAKKLAGWNALLQMVEVALSDEIRPCSAERKTSEANDDHTAFITHKGGTILVDRAGTMLYKYVEDETSQWPSVDELLSEVKKAESSITHKPSVTTTAKVDSEVSAKDQDEKKKQCCTIL